MDTNQRNNLLFYVDTILFVIAMSFISINTVIPYFLNTLGATTFEISLASTLVGVGTFISQPYFAHKVIRLAYKIPTFIRILSIQRFFFLGFVLTIPFLVNVSPRFTILVFLICWGIFNFFVGAYSPFFMSLFSKMVPDKNKGRLLGYSSAIGNVVALLFSIIIGILLTRLPFPYNFTCIFGLGTFFLLLDNLDFLLMKEPPDKIIGQPMNTWEYIKNIPTLFKNYPKIATLITGYSLFVISNVSLVYYTLYAIRRYHAQATEIALFTGIAIAINILGNILFGIIADHHSYRLVLQIAAVCGSLASIIILTIPGLFAVFFAFSLSNLCACGYMLCSSILIMKNAPEGQFPIFISTNIMVTLVISSVFSLVSGLIVDRFSFSPIFVLTGLAGCGAFFIMTFIFKISPASTSQK